MNEQLDQVLEEFAGKINVAFQFFPLEAECNQVVAKDLHAGACEISYMAAYDPAKFKAIHDEMNATAFDEFGRMQANLGVEAVPATPGQQNVVLYPYVNPATELIDATNLPKGDINVTPIGLADDGAQIWKITHNGVDTHPIHWHLYDVQVLNRVTWDNIIIPPEAVVYCRTKADYRMVNNIGCKVSRNETEIILGLGKTKPKERSSTNHIVV